MWLKETRYLTSKLAHPQVHRMYFRFCRTYGLSSTREILNPECTDPVQLLRPVQQSSRKHRKHTKQPVRKQVRLYILIIICLRLRLLAGPYHLPKLIPHTVQNDQPLKDIKMDTHITVCMYIRWRVKSASREKR